MKDLRLSLRSYLRLSLIVGPLPSSIANGTVEDATAVMANFNWLMNQVNANAAPLSSTPQLNTANTFTQPQSGAAGTALGNFPTLGQLQAGGPWVCTAGGTGNTITLTASPAPSAYAAGQFFIFVPPAPNTGSTTINVNGLGAKAVVMAGGAPLQGGEFGTGNVVIVFYDGTLMRVLATGSGVPAGFLSTEGDIFARSAAGNVVRIPGPANWQIPIGLLQGNGGPVGAIEWGHVNGFIAAATVDQINDLVMIYSHAVSQNRAMSPNNLLGGVRPAFAANSTNGQAMASNAFTKIQFTNVYFDTNNNYDHTTNYRFTPTVAGVYVVIGVCALAAVNAGKGVGVAVYKNGAELIQTVSYAGNVAAAPNPCVVAICQMNGSTDYLEIYGYNGDSVSQNMSSNAAVNMFAAARLA